LTSDVAKTVGFIENLKEEKEHVSSNLNEAEDNYARKVQEKEKLEQELNEFKSREHELNSILNSLNDKTSFIQNLVDNLEGVSLGTKSLLELTGWANGKVILLANAGNSSDNLRPAVEAALRNNVNDILISSIEELKKGVEHLKNNNLGRASFYLNPNGDNSTGLIGKLQKYFSSRQRKKIEADSSFKSWASSAVQSEGSWKKFFDKLLCNTAIVNDLDSAISLSQKFSDFRFVTLDGDLAEGTGLIESGSPVADESLFGKRQLLLEIKKEIPLKQNELNELSQKISEYESVISKIDLKVLSDQGRMLVNDLANIDKQISQFEFEKKKANDEIEKTHHLIKDIAAESNELDNDRTRISEQLTELQNQKSIAESHCDS
jgi:chromosome segregation protein